MDELRLFPQQVSVSAKAIILNFGAENELYALDVLKQCRAAGVAAEIYPDAAKFDKQMKYANKRGVAYVLLPGDEERQTNSVSIKNFVTGEQKKMTIADAIDMLKG
jgi:histidyl-tRNA synthetase